MIEVPLTVFVPFQVYPLSKKKERKRDDLPRFLTAEEVKDYISAHPGLQGQCIEWREHAEKDMVREFIDGIGRSR